VLQEETAKRLLARPHYDYDMDDVPEWAYYEVLGFKTDKETALKTAMRYFEEQGYDSKYLQQLKARLTQNKRMEMTSIFRGLKGYLEPRTGLTAQAYTKTYGTSAPKYILAFCSSTLLPEDPEREFWAETVQPQKMMKNFEEYSKLLGLPAAQPVWCIPDQALNIAGMLNGMS